MLSDKFKTNRKIFLGQILRFFENQAPAQLI